MVSSPVLPQALLWQLQKRDTSQGNAVHHIRVRRKSCLISILPTCSLEAHSISVITAESFLVFRFQPWSHGLWELFGAERSLCEQGNEDDPLEMKMVPCTWMPCALGCVHPYDENCTHQHLWFPQHWFWPCMASVGQSLAFQISKALQMYLL